MKTPRKLGSPRAAFSISKLLRGSSFFSLDKVLIPYTSDNNRLLSGVRDTTPSHQLFELQLLIRGYDALPRLVQLLQLVWLAPPLLSLQPHQPLLPLQITHQRAVGGVPEVEENRHFLSYSLFVFW